MNVTDKHVLFWGEWPSNWYRAEFNAEVLIDGKKETKHFYNSEQYFMYMKAIIFGDYEIAEKILATKDPKKAKELGRIVRNYDDKVWNDMRYKVMVDANKAKYSQNEDLKKLITSDEFKGKGFVEASKYDNIWGIKLTEDNPDADIEEKWQGQNLLGKALDEVRTWLLGQ
jgi:ribA/ribD-fused uncharacterized protein